MKTILLLIFALLLSACSHPGFTILPKDALPPFPRFSHATGYAEAKLSLLNPDKVARHFIVSIESQEDVIVIAAVHPIAGREFILNVRDEFIVARRLGHNIGEQQADEFALLATLVTSESTTPWSRQCSSARCEFRFQDVFIFANCLPTEKTHRLSFPTNSGGVVQLEVSAQPWLCSDMKKEAPAKNHKN